MVETDRAAVIKLFQAKRKQILNLMKMSNGRRIFVYEQSKDQETGTVKDKVRQKWSSVFNHHSQGQKGDQ